MKKLLSIFIIFMLMFSTIAFAETRVQVDLEKLDPNSRNAVINAQKAANETAKVVSKENFELFKDYGKVIAETFAEVCKTLNIEVNKFADTPVGKLTMWLIIYKVIGPTILNLGMWFSVTIMCLAYAYIFHMPKKIVQKDEKKNIVKVEYIQKYHWNDNSAKSISAFLVGLVWVGATLITYYKI